MSVATLTTLYREKGTETVHWSAVNAYIVYIVVRSGIAYIVVRSGEGCIVMALGGCWWFEVCPERVIDMAGSEGTVSLRNNAQHSW